MGSDWRLQPSCLTMKICLHADIPRADLFREMIYDCGLIELKPSGCWYTRNNCRKNDRCVFERLDRILCHARWTDVFPYSWTHCLPMAASNHSPMLMD